MSGVKFVCDWGQCVGEQALEQATSRNFSVGQTRLEPAAQRHELVDFCNDPMLLGERWQRNHKAAQ